MICYDTLLILFNENHRKKTFMRTELLVIATYHLAKWHDGYIKVSCQNLYIVLLQNSSPLTKFSPSLKEVPTVSFLFSSQNSLLWHGCHEDWCTKMKTKYKNETLKLCQFCEAWKKHTTLGEFHFSSWFF